MLTYSRRGRQLPDTYNVTRGLRCDVCIAERCLLCTCYLRACAIPHPSILYAAFSVACSRARGGRYRQGITADGRRSGAPGGVPPNMASTLEAIRRPVQD